MIYFYLLVTTGYLVDTSGYLVITSGYFWLLLVTSGNFWFLVLVVTSTLPDSNDSSHNFQSWVSL